MNAFAPVLAALAIAQAEPPPVRASEPPPAEPAAAPAPAPASEPVAAPAAEPERARAKPADAPPAPDPSAVSTARKRTAAPPPRVPTPTRRPTATRTSTAPPSSRPSPPLREGEDAERAARAFLAALAARDAEALAAASAERFSFDGDVQAGRDAVRRTWRTILAGREDAPAPIGALEVLPAAAAVARLGKPPARIAPLARPGVLVAVADVGGRAVVLFLAREGGRMAVVGMHD
jgi:hypothetical protein